MNRCFFASLLFSFSLASLAGSPADLSSRAKAWEALSSPDKANLSSADITRWLVSWVDAEAWAELPGFLDACGKNVKASTAELRLLAEVWDRLGNDEKAALTMLKAAEMAGSEGALWLAAAKMHARTQKFSEARKSLAKMGDNAAVELVAVAMKLSWQMAQTEGQTETVLPVLKKQAEARPTDTALLLMVMEWEVEHGRNTDATISKLREQVSAAKSPELRLPWRRLLVTALSRQGKLNEAPEEAEAWLIESKQGSAEERTAMTALLRSLERESTGRGSKPAEPLKQLAGRLVSRLAVFQTLLTWLADRGQAAEALALLDQYPEISADDLRVELLTLTDRHAEAAALLQRKGDAHSRLCAALLQRDLGERELAARGLESWAARGEAQRSEVESIVPVLSLLRNQSEMQEWRQNAARRFPESHIFSARTSPKTVEQPPEKLDEVESQLAEIMKEPDVKKRISSLLKMRQVKRQELRVALILLPMLLQSQRQAEAWVMIRALELDVADSAARLDLWKRVLAAIGAEYVGQAEITRIASAGGSAEFWLALSDWHAWQNSEMSLVCLERLEMLIPQDEKFFTKQTEAFLRVGRIEELTMLCAAKPDNNLRHLCLARAAFQRGQPEVAARGLLTMALHPALTAEQAQTAALDLLTWQMLPEAESFVLAQQSRFPDDYRFSALQALIQREKGQTESAISTLLSLGSYQTELPIDDAQKMMLGLWRDYEGDAHRRGRDLSFGSEVQMQEVQQMLQQVSSTPALLARRMQEQRGEREPIMPIMLRQIKVWATAHLIEMAQNMTAVQRASLATRAAAAGFPMPLLIELGSIKQMQGSKVIELDKAKLEARLNEPEMAALWLRQEQQRMAYRQNGITQPVLEVAAMRRVLAALAKAKSTEHLAAAQWWWGLQPESVEAVQAMAAVIARSDVGIKSLPLSLPWQIEQRREPLWQRVMEQLLELTAKHVESSGEVELIRGYLALGRWEKAVEFLNLQRKAQDPTSAAPIFKESAAQPPAWLHLLQPSPPLSWPSASAMAYYFQTPYSYNQQLNQVKWLLFSDAEKPAYLAAASALQHPADRVAWLQAGG